MDGKRQPAAVRIEMYHDWRKRKNAPLVDGVYIKDMKTVDKKTGAENFLIDQ